MEKTKLLTITIVGLLLLNLGTLCFLFFNGQKRHHTLPGEGRPEPREIIIEKLHLDSNQQKEYDKLIQWHKTQIKKLDENIRQAKKELYIQLAQSETNVKVKDSLTTLLADYQKQIEETHFKHFEDIKKLCHKDQIKDFDTLTEELGRLFTPNKPPRPRHD